MKLLICIFIGHKWKRFSVPPEHSPSENGCFQYFSECVRCNIIKRGAVPEPQPQEGEK